MESVFGMENMARQAAIERMIQTYEKEIRDFASLSNLVRQSVPMQRAWYCPLLVHTGEVLIALGTRLITRYSIQTTLQAR
jgi:hypothetical protein